MAVDDRQPESTGREWTWFEFDTAKRRHEREDFADKVTAHVCSKHGDGWQFSHIEDHPEKPGWGRARLWRYRTTARIHHDARSSFAGRKALKAELPNAKASDAARLVATYEEGTPGYTVTRFDPYRGFIILEQLTADELRAREALSAALRVAPWDIQVAGDTTDGFDIILPPSFRISQQASLDEVATGVIGRPGWYVEVDAKNLTAKIIPAQLPTFDPVYPTPMGSVEPFDHTDKKHYLIPLGRKLPPNGDSPPEVFCLDMDKGAHTQFGGVSGAGKSVTINCFLAQWRARGAEIAVLDLPAKSVDFRWIQPYLRPHGWGCDSPAHAAVVATLIHREGERRSRILADAGVNDWKDLPAGQGFPPLILLMDEVTGMYAMEDVPKGKSEKIKALAEAAEEVNFHKQLLKSTIKRIAAEWRFCGVFLAIASQVASVNTGIDTALRTNLHHKILLGAKPTENNRKLVYSNPQGVPAIPEHIREDGTVNRGVGAAEPEGDAPVVFKSFFARPSDYAAWFERLGIPKRPISETLPTAEQIADILGDDDGADTAAPRLPGRDSTDTARRRAAMPDPMAELMGASGHDWQGNWLTGAALAAAQTAHLKRLADNTG